MEVKMMTLPELKRIIKKYDDLMGIVVKGKSAKQLRSEIEDAGYTIDDGKKRIIRLGKVKDKKKRPVKVEAGEPVKPKPKSEAEKKEAMDKKVANMIKMLEKAGYEVKKRKPKK